MNSIVPEEVREYLLYLRESLPGLVKERKWTGVFHHLVQLGLGPHEEEDGFGHDRVSNWLHNNQAKYSLLVAAEFRRAGVGPDGVRNLLKVAYRDLRAKSAEWDTSGAYGKISSKEYNRGVIIPFLKSIRA